MDYLCDMGIFILIVCCVCAFFLTISWGLKKAALKINRRWFLKWLLLAKTQRLLNRDDRKALGKRSQAGLLDADLKAADHKFRADDQGAVLSVGYEFTYAASPNDPARQISCLGTLVNGEWCVTIHFSCLAAFSAVLSRIKDEFFAVVEHEEGCKPDYADGFFPQQIYIGLLSQAEAKPDDLTLELLDAIFTEAKMMLALQLSWGCNGCSGVEYFKLSNLKFEPLLS